MTGLSSGSGSVPVNLSGLPDSVVRPRRHVESVLAQSVQEMGLDGRVWQAWRWVLTGDQLSPVTLAPAPGSAPSREEILAERVRAMLPHISI